MVVVYNFQIVETALVVPPSNTYTPNAMQWAESSECSMVGIQIACRLNRGNVYSNPLYQIDVGATVPMLDGPPTFVPVGWTNQKFSISFHSGTSESEKSFITNLRLSGGALITISPTIFNAVANDEYSFYINVFVDK